MFFLEKCNEMDILSILYLPVAAERCPGPDPLPLAFVWSWVKDQRSSAITWYAFPLINESWAGLSDWPVAILVLPPLTCLYYPGLYSKQQVSLTLIIKLSLTAFIVATVVVPCSLLDILKACHPQRTSRTTHSKSNRKCSSFLLFPYSHLLMLLIGEGNSCPTWQEIFRLRLCWSTLWVLSITYLLPSTH